VTCAPLAADGPPRVAYAVGRPVGTAVARNRVRRQLQAAIREHADALQPGCAYLVSAGPRARASSYAELSAAVRQLLVEVAP
jgi:ribonuclease P protein component